MLDLVPKIVNLVVISQPRDYSILLFHTSESCGQALNQVMEECSIIVFYGSGS